MSINAISSVSLYEYYYTINKKEDERKESPLEKEMKKYGLTPTASEEANIAMLRKAKADSLNKTESQTIETPAYERPWADLMYQLNLNFNTDPKDDIADIKEELVKLLEGLNDEELQAEINDLESYVENLYLSYSQSSSGFDNSSTLTAQLNNLSLLNQVRL